MSADRSPIARSSDSGRASASGSDARTAADLVTEGVEPDGPPSERAELLRTIEAEILPRLMLTHPGPAGATVLPLFDAPTRDEVRQIAAVAAFGTLEETRAFLSQVRSRGVPVETLLMQLLAPAARLLGDDWLADRVSFTDVTVGLCRIQQLVHALGSIGRARREDAAGAVALAPAAGEQHTLGLHILAELFRKAGWLARLEIPGDGGDLLGLVQDEWFDLVGLSVSSRSLVGAVARQVRDLRAATQNKAIVIVIGGAIDLRAHLEETGADGWADTVDEALRILPGRERAKVVRRT